MTDTRSDKSTGDDSHSESEVGKAKRTEFLTARQLAEVLQISESTIHRLRRTGRIPAVMVTDRLIRFNLREVRSALRGREYPAGRAEPGEMHDPQMSFDELVESEIEN